MFKKKKKEIVSLKTIPAVTPECFFAGTYFLPLDNKNRISIPARWAVCFGGEIAIKKGYDGCFEMRTEEIFKEYFYNPDIKNYILDKYQRILKRHTLGNAYILSLDSQNKLSIPTEIIRELSLYKHEICLIGLGDYIEIWDPELYLAWKNNKENSFENLTNENLTTKKHE